MQKLTLDFDEPDDRVAPDPHSDPSYQFDVVAGDVYELRVLLQAKIPGFLTHDLSVVFLDRNGVALDPRLLTERPVVPDLDPCVVDVAPLGDLSDIQMASAEATRFLLAPPDAVRLVIGDPPAGLSLKRAILRPVAAIWTDGTAKVVAGTLDRIAERRHALAAQAFANDPDRVASSAALADVPARQMRALDTYFARGGDWNPVIESLADPAHLDEHDVRLSRARADVATLPRAGFIGSCRGHERVSAMADVIWLRERSWHDQLSCLDLDLIVIETVPVSGLDGDADWLMAFSSFDGAIPDRGAALFDEAEKTGIPIHLWFSGDPDVAPLWRDAALRAARVVAEGGHADWSALGPDCVLPRATEPSACSLAHRGNRPCDLMLVPVASDVFQFDDFNCFLARKSLYAPLLTEFDYGFDATALNNRFEGDDLSMVAFHTRAQERVMLQAARIVLLSARTVRSDAALAKIALDAIASGAIPVLYGRYEGRDPILLGLDTVGTIEDLCRLQALWRVFWVFERRWRALFLHVMRAHVWNDVDKAALLGLPEPEDSRPPRITAIMSTKRPHLARRSLETFRRQTWPNKELILVFNTGTVPEDLPPLAENERAFALPEASPIGECLNMGIYAATGTYWAKMDDDDHYSTSYLEETVYYFRAAQADVVGRQSALFHFASDETTKLRKSALFRCFTVFEGTGHISGATLAADTRRQIPLFNVNERNSVDSSWVIRVVRSHLRVFSGDSSSMVVFRDSDETRHTWKMSAVRANRNILTISRGNLHDRIEDFLHGPSQASVEIPGTVAPIDGGYE